MQHVVVGMVLGLAWLATSQTPARAQERVRYYDYMHPDLSWHTVETEHFLIHFHADTTGTGANRTARVVARIAEDIYEPITSLYEYEPDTKVSIVLKDYEDYSNGAAYFFENKIDIWAPSLTTSLRGESAWLRNVITHEFTHIVQVQKTMRGSRRWPFFYFQWLAYEDVRRPDVLYGYPDVIVSYPMVILNNPAWFAEGTAQYQRADLHYDRWDTHRDMLLRSRFLGEKDLSISEMGDLLSKTSLEREQVYNQGFAFTTYLANEYGESALREVSDRLGNWTNWTIESAMKDALGDPGKEVFERWASQLRTAYFANTSEIRTNEHSGRILESSGAFNFSPRFSPDGSRVAYVSNKGSDYRRFGLHVASADSGQAMAVVLDGVHHADPQACLFGHATARAVTGSISWSPDGSKVAFARTLDTSVGRLYADLFEVDVATEEERRITTQARATEPSYSPDGTEIIYVGQSDGTTNVYLVATEGESEPRKVTDFRDGTQVYSPVWHPNGTFIYFALGPREGNRDIYRVKRDGSSLSSVLASTGDERDPAFSPDGEWLYYSSDKTGIFNLYRIKTDGEGLQAFSTPEQITNVIGGAFSPDVSSTGAVVYSQFGSDGYKIAVLERATPVRPVSYEPPSILQKRNGSDSRFDWAGLNAAVDSDIRAWPAGIFAEPPDSTASAGEVTTSPAPSPTKYGDTFSSFQFFPVLRLDMYADADRASIDLPEGRSLQGGELLRNTKLGLYMASREVLDGLSFTAGLLIGPWSKSWDSTGEFFSPSRFDKLERDVFFRFDYRKGLPFFKKRWAPQLSVEFFNVVRNVENGLAIEEFPCTACYPDTTYANISYSLWEVNVMSRSKLNRYSMLELGYRYSPYRARTDVFFSEEQGISIPASSVRYFIGHTITAKLYLERLAEHLNSDILPVGFRAEVGYEFQPSQLLDDFTVEDGLLLPEYTDYKNHRLLADLRLGWKLPIGRPNAPHGLGVRARVSTILGGGVDSFFNDYVGGLIAARGYPFYALGGNETIWMQLSYQFPVFARIGKQFAFLHLNKLWARVYGDAATAWTSEVPGVDDIRTDLGLELRLGISSFYLLPTAAFLSATYGFDKFIVRLDEGFVTPDGSQFVEYGGQLLWHFGVLFEFDL